MERVLVSSLVLSATKLYVQLKGNLKGESVTAAILGNIWSKVYWGHVWCRVIREDADSHTAGIFIWDTACFHCFSMNCDS